MYLLVMNHNEAVNFLNRYKYDSNRGNFGARWYVLKKEIEQNRTEYRFKLTYEEFRRHFFINYKQNL